MSGEHRALAASSSNSIVMTGGAGAAAVAAGHRRTGSSSSGSNLLYRHARTMSNNSNNLNLGGGGSNSLSPDLSDDEVDLEHLRSKQVAPPPPPADSLTGNLSKWTNYIHGWQDRFFALKQDGSLVYYKSVNDTDFGCRGAISIQKARVKPHELDELRFDVSVNDCNWYLRARSLEDRQKWVDALETHKNPQQIALQQQQQMQQLAGNGGNGGGLNRHGSVHSLSSNSFSGGSSRPGGSAKGRGLTEKLAEMETFRDILCRQIDTLQSYFDACAELAAASSPDASGAAPPESSASAEGVEDSLEDPEDDVADTASLENGAVSGARALLLTKDVVRQHGAHSVDFKGEAITFKATTAGILATLGHCIDLMSQREEGWRRRVEREQVARRLAEEKARSALEFAQADPSSQAPRSPSLLPKLQPPKIHPHKQAPDFEEGPHSQIGEDEFYDAVEDALDRLEEEQSSIDRLKRMGPVGAGATAMQQQQQQQVASSPAAAVEEDDSQYRVEEATLRHHLWPVIEKTTEEQLHYARLLPGGRDGVWELFAEEGEMKMYKREEEVDGMVVDPLKALHQVRGVTARELCHHFFSPDVRMEWETTLDRASVIEKVSEDTLLFLQLHKRIWPAAQRDSCFWSHMRKIKPGTGKDLVPSDAHDTYLVCNRSVEHVEAPRGKDGVLRVDLVVIFVCDTVIDESKRGLPDSKVSRSDLSCRITYCSVVNPGGWAPASVLRTVYKREYPRFLKRFTGYVIDKCKSRPIMW